MDQAAYSKAIERVEEKFFSFQWNKFLTKVQLNKWKTTSKKLAVAESQIQFMNALLILNKYEV